MIFYVNNRVVIRNLKNVAYEFYHSTIVSSHRQVHFGQGPTNGLAQQTPTLYR